MTDSPDLHPKKLSIMEKLVGDEKTHSLENRVFNLISLLVIFIGTSTAVLNFFLGNPVREIMLSAISAIAALVFYVASIRYYYDRYLRTPIVVFFLIILSVAWLTNQGLQGNTPLFFIILFTASTILLRFPYNALWLSLSFIVVLLLLTTEWAKPELILPYLSESHRQIDVSVSIILSLIFNAAMVHLVVKEYQKERLRSEKLYQQTLHDKETLQQALANIKVLEGILPVCSFCKKIRDENNEWHAVEDYISSHSKAAFSHSYCPECAQKHFPDYYDK
ncbi:hypothetical protein KC799_18195 [candidate division KSB1 bacterium]|nr:hypothetical protein [candidate division KSB1 bacterium]